MIYAPASVPSRCAINLVLYRIEGDDVLLQRIVHGSRIGSGSRLSGVAPSCQVSEEKKGHWFPAEDLRPPSASARILTSRWGLTLGTRLGIDDTTAQIGLSEVSRRGVRSRASRPRSVKDWPFESTGSAL